MWSSLPHVLHYWVGHDDRDHHDRCGYAHRVVPGQLLQKEREVGMDKLGLADHI
jgi:hypothetical protein